jgi:hypothetical protein
MPRYLVERTFPGDLGIPDPAVLVGNTDEGVTWMHSYVSEDRRKTFCIYEAPSPEAIRKPPPGTSFRWSRSRRSEFLIPTPTQADEKA